MARPVKRWILAAALAGLMAACASDSQEPAALSSEPIALSPQASRVVQEYRQKIGGRLGALAVSTDGTRASYHICQSRLWKNCDDYELNDRFVSIPSGRIAGEKALARCGGGCVILYMNEKEMRPSRAS